MSVHLRSVYLVSKQCLPKHALHRRAANGTSHTWFEFYGLIPSVVRSAAIGYLARDARPDQGGVLSFCVDLHQIELIINDSHKFHSYHRLSRIMCSRQPSMATDSPHMGLCSEGDEKIQKSLGVKNVTKEIHCTGSTPSANPSPRLPIGHDPGPRCECLLGLSACRAGLTNGN